MDRSRHDTTRPTAPAERTATAAEPVARSARPRADLHRITWEGVAFGAMVGIGETYVPAFALALGYGGVVAALLPTVPLIVGSALQLLAPRGCRWIGSPRRWAVACATVQALSFAPFVVLGIRGTPSLFWLFLAAVAYWGSGMSIGPIWNTWVGRLVPGPTRFRFFARRTAYNQMTVFLGILSGGLLLHARAARSADHATVLHTFAMLFGVAFVARVVSLSFLARQTDVPFGAHAPVAISPASFVHRLRHTTYGRLLRHVLLMQLAVTIASPFFTPYMLGPLDLNYGEYLLLISTSFVAKVLLLPVWGRVMRVWGARPILILGSVGIATLPALWLFSDAILYLVAIQLLAGALWAGFEYTVLIVQLESASPRERAGFLSLYNLANSLVVVLGMGVGIAWLRSAGNPAGGFDRVFVVSTLARFAVLMFAFTHLPKVSLRDASVVVRTMAVRPSLGTIARPIHAAFTRARRRGDPARATGQAHPRPTNSPER